MISRNITKHDGAHHPTETEEGKFCTKCVVFARISSTGTRRQSRNHPSHLDADSTLYDTVCTTLGGASSPYTWKYQRDSFDPTSIASTTTSETASSSGSPSSTQSIPSSTYGQTLTQKLWKMSCIASATLNQTRLSGNNINELASSTNNRGGMDYFVASSCVDSFRSTNPNTMQCDGVCKSKLGSLEFRDSIRKMDQSISAQARLLGAIECAARKYSFTSPQEMAGVVPNEPNCSSDCSSRFEYLQDTDVEVLS